MNPRTHLATGLAVALMLTTMPGPRAAAEGLRVPAIDDTVTREECSACHMPYPASLLPKRSWHALMSDLPNHFGEDASLDPAVTQQISDYLEANASDTGGRFTAILRGLADTDVPLRISELPIMTRVHYEVGSRWRKRVGSMAKCGACHRGAENGNFFE